MRRAFSFTFLLLAAVAVFSEIAGAQTNLTYENWAQGFFTLNCLGCHNTTATGDDRFNAPRRVNFDTLELIRDQADLIREVAIGEHATMPPAGVVWWWDRVSLEEWLDAGLPGEADTLFPATVERKLRNLAYTTMGYQFGRPVDENENWEVDGDEFNHRYLSLYPETEEGFEGMITERSAEIERREDGIVVLLSLEWFRRNSDWSETTLRLLSFSPPIPLFLGGPETEGQTWQSSVTVRERYWDGWWGGTPELDVTRTEQWLVESLGLETVDNGVIRPSQALRFKQTNLTEDITYDWWFEKGVGLVRREISAPSADYIRDITREMNIATLEYPLYGPHIIEDASEDWIPFVGRWDDYAYWYEFEVQNLALVDDTVGPEPTASPTLDPDPAEYEPDPTATFTPFPAGLPPQQPTATRTATLPPVATATFTQGGGGGSNPTPTMDPDDPNNYDHNQDHVVDMNDLLMFLKQWHQEMK